MLIFFSIMMKKWFLVKHIPISRLQCKNHTLFMTKMAEISLNWYPIYEQNSRKTIPFGSAHTYIAHIRESPPLPRENYTVTNWFSHGDCGAQRNRGEGYRINKLAVWAAMGQARYSLKFATLTNIVLFQSWSRKAASKQYVPAWKKSRGGNIGTAIEAEKLLAGRSAHYRTKKRGLFV